VVALLLLLLEVLPVAAVGAALLPLLLLPSVPCLLLPRGSSSPEGR
jgi:hypothetical protein